MNKNSKIFVAGHRGLVGSAVMRELQRQGYTDILTATRDECDLSNQERTHIFFGNNKPEYVFLCAAKVGGIVANSSIPAAFITENLKIQTNVIESAWKFGAQKFLFAGSGCVYPRDCIQPIKEEYLLTGPLEKTNEAYAVAKIAGIKMCEYYRKQYGFDAVTVMPANVYGPFDNFSLETSHVVPALIRKFHDAEDTVTVWGSGMARREFLHVDDLASAMVFLMQVPVEHDIVNIGSGEERTIADLAVNIADAIGFKGKVIYDASRPDGTPRKLLDSSKLYEMGWKPKIGLREGLALTYAWFRDNYGSARK